MKKKFLDRHTPVNKYDLTGQLICTYKNVREAAILEDMTLSQVYIAAKKELIFDQFILRYGERRLNVPTEPIDLEGEIWKDIEGYEGMYKISNKSRVKSYQRGKIKIMRHTVNTAGYHIVELSKNNERKSFRVHRLLAQAFVPNPDNKPVINHINGTKDDNSLNNLEWVTTSENIHHAYMTGLRQSGDQSPNRKVSDAQVLFMRNLYRSEHFLLRELSQLFGISESNTCVLINSNTRG